MIVSIETKMLNQPSGENASNQSKCPTELEHVTSEWVTQGDVLLGSHQHFCSHMGKGGTTKRKPNCFFIEWACFLYGNDHFP